MPRTDLRSRMHRECYEIWMLEMDLAHEEVRCCFGCAISALREHWLSQTAPTNEPIGNGITEIKSIEAAPLLM
jgi:hypothetical protein